MLVEGFHRHMRKVVWTEKERSPVPQAEKHVFRTLLTEEHENVARCSSVPKHYPKDILECHDSSAEL